MRHNTMYLNIAKLFTLLNSTQIDGYTIPKHLKEMICAGHPYLSSDRSDDYAY